MQYWIIDQKLVVDSAIKLAKIPFLYIRVILFPSFSSLEEEEEEEEEKVEISTS